MAAAGGRVQEIAPDGTIVWEFIYSDANHLSHHDLTLIGDNVLLTKNIRGDKEIINNASTLYYLRDAKAAGEPADSLGGGVVFVKKIFAVVCIDRDRLRRFFASHRPRITTFDDQARVERVRRADEKKPITTRSF